jgi:hypothetical protein
MDNPFNTPISGQGDWDTGLSGNFGVVERGYHVTERAGQAVSTGQIVAMTSGGWMLPFNPSSSLPCLGYAYTAAASGDAFTVIGHGIMRSLDINSSCLGGQLMFSNASGFLSVTTNGAPVGIGLSNKGVFFNPSKFAGAGAGAYSPAKIVNSVTISAVVNSLHTFTMSIPSSLLWGWNRRIRINGSSAPNVELKFYRDAGVSDLQYQTLSGGVSAVASFHDRAGWPIDTDSGTVYGTLKVFSSGGVNSDTIYIQAEWQT